MIVLDMIKSALRTAGLISESETPSAEMAKISLALYNQIIELWRNENLLTYCLQTKTFKLQQDTQAYTIGHNGTWVMPARPLAILSAKIIGSSGDNHLKVVDINEKNILLSGYYGMPTTLWYNPDWPLGTVYLYPIPNIGAADIVISCRNTLVKATDINDNFDYPDGYEALMRYSLALELCLEYGISPTQLLVDRLRNQRAVIKRANSRECIAIPDIASEGFDITTGW